MSASDEWDISLKILFKERPRDLLRWLMPGAIYKRSITAHLPDSKLDADTLHQVIVNGKKALVHVEFQSYRDPRMAERLWHYNVRATIFHKLPVYSFVIYLRKERRPASSPYILEFPDGQEIHRFHFSVIKLWEISAEMLKQMQLAGVLPLLCLAQGGKHRDVVEDAITGIQRTGGKSAGELLALTYIIASLVFTREADQDWLKRRFNYMRNILREAWAYKEIKKEGLEEGRQEGRQEVLHQVLEEQRQLLVEIVQGRFPAIEQLARETVDSIADLGALQRMLVKLSLARTEEEAKQVILKAAKAKK